MNMVDILQDPKNMDDYELEKEMKAVHSLRFLNLIQDESISDRTKQKLISHKESVIREKKRRDECGEWFIPLCEFGIFDF